MEYSPALKLYTSRLYFTETRGGVLGANAMQGKPGWRDAAAAFQARLRLGAM